MHRVQLPEKVTVKDADGSELVRFAYSRDAGGNPIAIEPRPPTVWRGESGLGVFYYEYDQLQRLAYGGQFVEAPLPPSLVSACICVICG